MRFTFALLSLLTFSSIVSAGECVPLSKVKADAMAIFKDATMAEMGGTEASAFLASLNAMPPKTDVRGDYVLAVTVPRKAVILVMFINGCAGATSAIPERVFHLLLQAL